MKYLVLLIVMALAGAAGWWGGSWRARDAIQALEKAQDLARQASAERDKIERDLKQELAAKAAEFKQGQAQRDAEHVQARSELTLALAGRDQAINELGRARAGTRTRIAQLHQQADRLGTPPEERQRLQAEIDRLKREVSDKDTQIAGLECSRVPVPQALLASLQGI